jgi:hypothetical protein
MGILLPVKGFTLGLPRIDNVRRSERAFWAASRAAAADPGREGIKEGIRIRPSGPAIPSRGRRWPGQPLTDKQIDNVTAGFQLSVNEETNSSTVLIAVNEPPQDCTGLCYIHGALLH